MEIFSIPDSISFGLPSSEMFKIPNQPYKHDPNLRPPPLNNTPRSFFHPFDIDPDLFRVSFQLEYVITFMSLYVTAVLFMNSVNASRHYRPWAFSKTSAFKAFVVAHNSLLALFSGWALSSLVYTLINYWPSGSTNSNDGYFAHIAEYLCQTQSSEYRVLSHSISPWEAGWNYIGWLFYMSKYYEVIDTMIILAKGKKSSMLQTYHHAGIILCGWATVVYDSPCGLVAAINVLVHTLMYTYFALQTLGFSVSTRVKRSLTTIQIAQFFIGMIFGTSFLFLSYKAPLDMSEMAVKNDSVLDFSPLASHGDTARLVPKDTMVPCLSDSGEAATIYVSTIYIWPLIFLFVRFFIQSYSPKKKQ